VFVSAALRFALVGDVLFQGSVGRTDFPYGDGAALIASIRRKLLPLGDDIAFLCGPRARLDLRAGAAAEPVPAGRRR
jgi:glyoxylase-like metal-dependent hydrolase (beta-lactamase superfamily II)